MRILFVFCQYINLCVNFDCIAICFQGQKIPRVLKDDSERLSAFKTD